MLVIAIAIVSNHIVFLDTRESLFRQPNGICLHHFTN